MNKLKRHYKAFLFLVGTLLLICAALIWLVPQTIASPNPAPLFDTSWNVVANGGTTMSSSSYTLQGTVGQAAAGELSSSNYDLIEGFWADIRSLFFDLFLPTIRGT